MLELVKESWQRNSRSHDHIQRSLEKIGLKYYNIQRAPKYTQKQLEGIPAKCRKLRLEFTDQETSIIFDDEKYFTFSGEETPGDAGFYSSNKEKPGRC